MGSDSLKQAQSFLGVRHQDFIHRRDPNFESDGLMRRHVRDCKLETMSLRDYFDHAITEEGTHTWTLRLAQMPQERQQELAQEVARAIVEYRCSNRNDLVSEWQSRANTSDPSRERHKIIEILIDTCVGLPDRTRSSDYVEGSIAEHLWYFIASEESIPDSIVRIHGPSLQVTEIGGDSLVLHRLESGALQFRLWEVKKYSGSSHAGGTITKACKQLKSEALRYLAKFSLLGQYDEDQEVTAFYAILMDQWVDSTSSAAAGVAIGTSGRSVPNPCFTQLPRHFDRFLDPRRLRGEMVAVDDFSIFARLVREQLWKGL